MSFAQITFRESLADIEICLRSRADQLYRLGFRSTVAHSTLADAKGTRDWRIYADLAQTLIRRARRLYAHEPLGLELDHTIYALNSTTLDRPDGRDCGATRRPGCPCPSPADCGRPQHWGTSGPG